MVGLTFDPPKLVSGIVDEAGEDEGMLPLLQYALKESWALRKRQHRNRRLLCPLGWGARSHSDHGGADLCGAIC